MKKRNLVALSPKVRERLLQRVEEAHAAMTPGQRAVARAVALNINACTVSDDERWLTFDLHKVKGQP